MGIPGLPPSLNQRLCCLTKDQTAMRDEFEQQLATIQEEIEALEAQIGHSPMTITSFTVSPSVAEVGATVSSLTFNWTLNKVLDGPGATQSISPTVGSVPPPDTAVVTPVSITGSTTYTLTVDDGTAFPDHSDTANATVNFRHKAYWGTSAGTTLDSSGILALDNSAFATSRVRTFTLDGDGEYIYYAYPASFGDATFTVNGFLTIGWIKTTVSFLNASGNLTLFNVYRSPEIQNGTGIQVSVT